MKNNNGSRETRSSLQDRIKRALELDEIVCRADALELRGRENLTVRGCRRILLYTEEEIRLLLCEYVLVIKGRRLYCSSYYTGALRVDGIISALEIEEKERSEK